jgi:hypothetical protein
MPLHLQAEQAEPEPAASLHLQAEHQELDRMKEAAAQMLDPAQKVGADHRWPHHAMP